MLYKFRFHFFAVPFRGLFRTFLNINQELFFSKLVYFFSVSNAIFKDEFPIKFYETVFMKTVINFQYFTPLSKILKKYLLLNHQSDRLCFYMLMISYHKL